MTAARTVTACHHIAELAAQIHDQPHPPATRRRARQIIRDAHHLATILPVATPAINRHAALHDGWPERGGDRVGRTSTTPRPTETTALGRVGHATTATVHAPAAPFDATHMIVGAVAAALTITRDAARRPVDDPGIQDLLDGARDQMLHAIAVATRWMPRPTEPPERCKGTGDEFGAGCTQIAAAWYRPDGSVDTGRSAARRCIDCQMEIEMRARDEADDRQRAERAKRDRIRKRAARRTAAT